MPSARPFGHKVIVYWSDMSIAMRERVWPWDLCAVTAHDNLRGNWYINICWPRARGSSTVDVRVTNVGGESSGKPSKRTATASADSTYDTTVPRDPLIKPEERSMFCNNITRAPWQMRSSTGTIVKLRPKSLDTVYSIALKY